MEMHVPEAQPAFEWILGAPVQKVSPQRRHALLQAALGEALRAWARGRGEVGTEWRFRIAPPGEVIRPLVPDVAYLAYDRMKDLSDSELEAPLLAPNLAVEILSPQDRRVLLDAKIAVYLAAGTDAVFVVDPLRRTLELHDGSTVRRFLKRGIVSHPSFPGLTIDLTDLFAVLQRPPR